MGNDRGKRPPQNGNVQAKKTKQPPTINRTPMTREEIRLQLAKDWEWKIQDELTDPSESYLLRNSYVQGWKAADEHPKNPWRDARLCPPENDENIYLSCNGVKRVGYYNLDSKTYRSYGIYGVCNVDADFWMPIPKTPKVSKQ